jgi:GT2 family glycosyltransferase
MISYIIPTHNRPRELAATLQQLGTLAPNINSEIIVVDNAGTIPARVPSTLDNGWNVTLHRTPTNLGAAARNVGALAARGEWLFMLDDDSSPMDSLGAGDLSNINPSIGALHTDIFVSGGGREQGGLPQVTVGCGMLVRRGLFNSLKAYDPTFGYYVEEYDLCARIIGEGLTVASLPTRVLHRKSVTMRSKVTILARLTRNNAWVTQRYAPPDLRRQAIARDLFRYRAIANRESALLGYVQGLKEFRRTRHQQPLSPLSQAQWDRFTGLEACREQLQAAYASSPFQTASLTAVGKNAHILEQALREFGTRIVPRDADILVIGTLSPGPARDALRLAEREPQRTVAVLPPSAHSPTHPPEYSHIAPASV